MNSAHATKSLALKILYKTVKIIYTYAIASIVLPGVASTLLRAAWIVHFIVLIGISA